MIKRLTAMVAALLLAIVMLAACGSTPATYQPTAFGPTVNGQLYCAYMVSPLECSGRPGIPYQMPLVQPGYYNPSGTDLLSQLFMWHLMYHAWYGSPSYYNHYVPVAYRTTYVTRYVTTFDTRYSSSERVAQSRATYRGSNGRTVSGNQVNTGRLAPPRNNGGSGTKVCGMSYGSAQSILAKGFGGSFGGSRSSGFSNSSKGGNRSGGTRSGC